jgi:hypothetical protein
MGLAEVPVGLQARRRSGVQDGPRRTGVLQSVEGLPHPEGWEERRARLHRILASDADEALLSAPQGSSAPGRLAHCWARRTAGARETLLRGHSGRGRLPRRLQGAEGRAVASTADLQGSTAYASRDVREGDQRLPCSRASLNSSCPKTGERLYAFRDCPGQPDPVSSSTLPNITNLSTSWQLRRKGENGELFNLLVHRPVQMPDGCWRFRKNGCGNRVYHGRKKRPIATGMVRPPTNTLVSFGSCSGPPSSLVAWT